MAIQTELKAPKGQYNSYGKYNYRSCEDILEAVKPLLAKYKCTLTIHDDIALVTFTGGTSTGERIAQKAKMIPLVMELGGKDPAIICEDANLELAAKQIVSGAYSYSGQRCTAIKRVLVHRSVADELVSLIQSEVEKLSVGSPEDNATIVPLIDEQSADFVQGLIDDALEKGATLVLGNKREENLIYPTLLDHVTKEMRIAWEEPFGPVLPIIRVDSQEEAIEIANASEYGLQASVFTQNLDKALTIARKLETGSIQINGRTERGPDHLPFIGIKKSGLGIQGVRRSIESMTREKVIILNINEIGDEHIEEVSFRADSLQCSANAGEWRPESDSSCILFGIQEDKNDFYVISQSY